MKRNKKTNVKNRNIPHEEENTLLVCSFYGFSGINCILAGACGENLPESLNKVTIVLGIVFLCMVPISFFDKRHGMDDHSYKGSHDMSNVILTGILHLFFSAVTSYAFSVWWLMGMYAAEVFCALFIRIKWRRIRRWIKSRKSLKSEKRDRR